MSDTGDQVRADTPEQRLVPVVIRTAFGATYLGHVPDVPGLSDCVMRLHRARKFVSTVTYNEYQEALTIARHGPLPGTQLSPVSDLVALDWHRAQIAEVVKATPEAAERWENWAVAS